MTIYILKRLPQLLVVIVAVLSLMFLLLHSSGDPAKLLVGPIGNAELLERVRDDLGLNRAITVQYVDFIVDAAAFDFGESFIRHESAMQLALEAFPRTAQLALLALLWAVLFGLVFGVLAALVPVGPWPTVVSGLALLGQSIPSFFLSILLVLVFSVQLRWLPAFGYGSLAHFILPSIALSMRLMAQIARLSRAELASVLRQDFVRTARAKGATGVSVILRHALRNSLIPVVSVIGLELGKLLGGSMIVEIIFTWPGTGNLLANAILRKDFPVIQASVFLFTVVVATLNLVTDITYSVLDPRIRYG